MEKDDTDEAHNLRSCESPTQEVPMLRRDFLTRSSIGLAAAFGALTLRSDADPTDDSGDVGDYGAYGKAKKTPAGPGGEGAPTEDNILGPFHRAGAPFRAKIGPPLS